MSLVFGEAGLNVGAVRLGGVLMVVVCVAVLSVVSFGDEMVALFVRVIVPVPVGAVVVIVIGLAAPTARFAFPVGAQVTVPAWFCRSSHVPLRSRSQPRPEACRRP